MNFFPSIGLGRILAKTLRIPWIIYSVDGIPSPIEWLDGDKTTHHLIATHINKSCRNADYIFSSNEYMMRYQQQICRDFHGVWDYLYTPYKQKQNYLKTCHTGYRFLYTGSLYGLRKIDGLLAGFRRFLETHPESQLIFVGPANPTYFTQVQDLIESNNILLYPFCDDLTVYYQEADVLVDIGADIPDDVFLSSKIVSYLPINRPILSITEIGSPARGIMGGLQSIIHCKNKEEDTYQALQNCISAIDKGIEDRNLLLTEFDSDTIVRKLFGIISN